MKKIIYVVENNKFNNRPENISDSFPVFYSFDRAEAEAKATDAWERMSVYDRKSSVMTIKGYEAELDEGDARTAAELADDYDFCEDQELFYHDPVEYAELFNGSHMTDVYMDLDKAIETAMRELIEDLADDDKIELPDNYDFMNNTELAELLQQYAAETFTPEYVINESGKEVYYPEAVDMMDDDVREDLHVKLAPCTNQEFFTAYEIKHFEKYNERWYLSRR